MGYSPRQGFGSHGRILRPGRNRTPPLADSASVPATGRQPSPVSTRAVIVTVLAVPALHTPASCRLAPPAFFIEDPSSTGSDPELHSSSIPPRKHQGTTLCSPEDFIAPPYGGTCLALLALDLQPSLPTGPQPSHTCNLSRRRYLSARQPVWTDVPPQPLAIVVPTPSALPHSHA